MFIQPHIATLVIILMGCHVTYWAGCLDSECYRWLVPTKAGFIIFGLCELLLFIINWGFILPYVS